MNLGINIILFILHAAERIMLLTIKVKLLAIVIEGIINPISLIMV